MLANDVEIVTRRLREALPLAAPSPHPASAASALRRQVLYALRTDGPRSPDQIAAVVGASRTGVLQQLHTLELAGLVSKTVIRHGVGRPRHVYDLAPSAQELFPANYAALAGSVLTAVDAIGGAALVNAVFQSRRLQLQERLTRRLAERLPAGASLWERTREVADFQDENGYLGRANRESDGTIRLCEHNCAIFDVAGRYPAACAAELRLLEDVLEARVSRECNIVAGDRSCTYRIEPRE